MSLLAIRKSPFLERDGGLRLKLGGAVGIVVGVLTLWLGSGGLMLGGADLENLAGWQSWDPPGRVLVALSLQLLIFVGGLGGTLLGAASIAEERDRGTWREILLTPLSPGEIILGKAAALTTTLLPFAILTAPVVAWGALVGDVRISDVALATGFAILHVPFFVSLGIAVSAHANSVRQATTSAVFAFFAVGVTLVIIPGSVLVGQIADHGFFPTFVPEVFAQVVLLVVGTLGCLMVARERIATRGQDGFAARRSLVFAMLTLPPTLLTLPLWLRHEAKVSSLEVFEMASVALVGIAALCIVCATLLLDVASSPTPRRTAMVDGPLAGVGLVVGGIAMAYVAPGLRDVTTDTLTRVTLGLGMALPFAITAFALASVTALLAARRGHSAQAALSSSLFVVVTVFVTSFFGLGSGQAIDDAAAAFLCVNPFAAAAAVVENILLANGLSTNAFVIPVSEAAIALGLAVHLGIAVLAMAFAGAGRRRA